MLKPTDYKVNQDLLHQAIRHADNDEFKLVLNSPTGDFFYDPWRIKPEFADTIWEKILNTLPYDKGEARIITLKPGSCYYSHADADDRWHLNLQSDHGFICDLDLQKMHLLAPDGIWYSMNAGRKHSAVNFGNKDRIQLVVRQLLKRNQLNDPVSVKIVLKTAAPDFRYQFDSTVSPWLNRANKQGIIANFKFSETEISLDIEQHALKSLQQITPDIFEVVQ